jgi:APA family basic amino acid/polyamine antiporter
MVPVSGSAYAYAYATLGELVAWIIGWDLVLEYAFGATTVSISWSGYFISLLTKTLGVELPEFAWRLTKGPFEHTAVNGHDVPGLFNLPAAMITLVLAGVLYRGMKESAVLNNIIVIVKMCVLVMFCVLGWSVVSSSNWFANPHASGLLALVPERTEILKEGVATETYGWAGVFRGAGVVFFAYIGFDALSTTAQECKNPRRDMPIGILASLTICTVLYIVIALVMTGVVPFKELGVPDPVAVGIDRIVELRGWPMAARKTFTFVVKMGAIGGLTSVMLVMMLGQTRVFYSMAKDGLLPWFDRLHPDFRTPYVATIVTGVFVAISGGIIPLTIVGELVSIGTLLAFVLVCLAIPILRSRQPDAPRPFRTPAYQLVAPAGALSCLWVMANLPPDTWARLVAWLAIGLCVYFFYGRHHSKVRAHAAGRGGAPALQ